MTISNPHTQTLPNGFSFDLLPVEAGSFMMGSNDDEAYSWEKPVHRVTIQNSFHIGKYPVTQDLWKAVLPGENPS